MPATSRSALRLALLGGFEARVGEGPELILPTRKSRALLAYLALGAPHAHPRDKLAALLWGDVPEEQAQQSLRKALSTVRGALDGLTPSPLVTRGDTVTLVPEAVDALAFEEHVRDGRPACLREAVALYRGDLLEGFRLDEPAFEQWLGRERERLRRLVIEALETLLAREMVRDRPEGGAEVALRLLEVDPLHEAAYRTLIHLYGRQGRREAALRQYRVCADSLWRELGVKPGAETERVFREVLAGPTAGKPNGHPRVLVVEDEIVTRARLQGLLADAGYEVVTAEDGADALLQLGQCTFDLVLADIQMPRLDGLKLLEVMREKRTATPLVLITGRSSGELETRCLEMGAADYVTKPFDGRALLCRIGKVLGREAMTMTPSSPSAP